LVDSRTSIITFYASINANLQEYWQLKKELEKKGVKILSCGICVDYYELTDHLEVGGTTTMAEVVEILTNSNLIVEP